MGTREEIEKTLDDLGYKADADGLAELVENHQKYKGIAEDHDIQTTIEQMADDHPRLFEIEQPDIPTYKGDRKEKKRPRFNPGIQKHNQHATPGPDGKDKGRDRARQRHRKRIM